MIPSAASRRTVKPFTVALLSLSLATACGRAPVAPVTPPVALTVKTTQAEPRDVSATIDTSGPLFAWQEVSIGSEVTGYRVQDVLVDVGDIVKKGQVLARLDSTVLHADRDQVAAQLAEADASVKEAKANAERAATLLKRGAISAQEADQQITGAATAEARAQYARAQLITAEQRLKYGEIVSPDDGVVSARTVAPGQIAASGTDLFKLIRKNRIEWRAEIPEAQFGKVRKGMLAQVKRSDGSIAEGRVRALSPSLSTDTHRGIAYVDLTLEPALSPGMYVTGSIKLGAAKALTLPLNAISMRDGFSYVFVVGPDDVVKQKRVTIGRIMTDAVEINDGVAETENVVAAGSGFLHDGDRVAVVIPGAAS
jgi:HlyD family secretion protein